MSRTDHYANGEVIVRKILNSWCEQIIRLHLFYDCTTRYRQASYVSYGSEYAINMVNMDSRAQEILKIWNWNYVVCEIIIDTITN